MTTLILCCIVSLALGLAAVMPAMMSPMLFDAPGSEKSVALKVALACLIALPLCLIGGSVTAGALGLAKGAASGWAAFAMMWKAVGVDAAVLAVSFGAASRSQRKRARSAG